MYISMCLYIIITIMIWVFSIYSVIKHYTIVILCYSLSLISCLVGRFLVPLNSIEK